MLGDNGGAYGATPVKPILYTVISLTYKTKYSCLKTFVEYDLKQNLICITHMA